MRSIRGRRRPHSVLPGFGLTLGFTLAIPLWLTAMCLAFVARSGTRAWAVCLATAALFATLVYGVPQ